ncbi:amidohydrolase family protein [Arthrobacter sp. A2-55]|uniref:amidohydrolase family protein n=1 Tax=Arthrobacter sp. A2-55 TaxID=2897337 RepID=UPI0021CD4E67|nr:amidohydrolase family protein [Arthrobacter sp. A2-55]MCU6479569.1 amidohydrolase family protein [Arthrobacter sp. A2-55]
MAEAGREPPRFAIRARHIFDGTAMLPANRTTVVVAMGRISAIETSGTKVDGLMPVHDLGEATLLPGLIDAHSHLVFDASDAAAANVQSASDQDLADAMSRRARAMLDHGITTVRDLGDRGFLSLTLRAETATRPAAGPRIVAAGPPITTTGGHCWFLGCEADDAETVTAAVDDHALRGVDVIKVMATGGRMTPTTAPHESQYSLGVLRAAAERAHFHGLPTAAHAHGRQGIHDALAAGFDTLEHASFMTATGMEPDPEIIEAAAVSGTIVSVTLGLLPGVHANPFMESLMPRILAHVKNMADRGVRITLGPDSGINAAKPPTVLPYAVEQFAAAGVGAAAALEAATATAAAACGLDGRAGRIAPGWDADLLAVTGNPLADITAIHQVAAVYRAGVRVV